MPPAKQTFHALLADGRHILVMPDEDLETSYRLFVLPADEVTELARRFGPAPDWMERLYHARELRRLLPPTFRHSLRGDFGSFEIGGDRVVKGCILPPERRNGTVTRWWGIVFDGQRFPGMVVTGVETYPDPKPAMNCNRLNLKDPVVMTPFFARRAAGREFTIGDVEKVVGVTEDGGVHVSGHGVHRWAPSAKLEVKRLIEPWKWQPEAVYLVKCLDEEDRFVVFFFDRVIILTCPVQHHATFYIERNGLRPEQLPGLVPDKRKALTVGFGRLVHVGHWLTRLGEIAETGQPRTWHHRVKSTRRV